MGTIRLLAFFAGFALVGCNDNVAEENARKRYAAERAANESIEKEAHSVPRRWYQVKLGKFSGECIGIPDSARQNVDAYHSLASLSNAQKIGEDYALDYRLTSPFFQRIYTTSISLCEQVIEANKGRQ